MSRVTLVGLPGDQQTRRAQDQLATIRGLRQEYSPCPPSLGELVRLPFMRDQSGRGYFGVPAIEAFVAKQKRP
jgi:hypothetical protein